jgi:hypothetical protein
MAACGAPNLLYVLLLRRKVQENNVVSDTSPILVNVASTTKAEGHLWYP